MLGAGGCGGVPLLGGDIGGSKIKNEVGSVDAVRQGIPQSVKPIDSVLGTAIIHGMPLHTEKTPPLATKLLLVNRMVQSNHH